MGTCYHYGNSVCPRCGELVGSYFWKWDERGRKVHLDCEVVVDGRAEG